MEPFYFISNVFKWTNGRFDNPHTNSESTRRNVCYLYEEETRNNGKKNKIFWEMKWRNEDFYQRKVRLSTRVEEIQGNTVIGRKR